MSGPKGGYAPYGKTGDGSYGTDHGKYNAFKLDPVRERIQTLLKAVPFPDKKSVFSIGDYGATDGSASMAFIRDLIIILREHHGPDVQVQVIYEDQAINDFNSLFKRLSGSISDPPSYLLELDDVFPMASGIDFRKQCVPSDSMHFILSMAAIHWLSKCPVMYKDSLYIYPDSPVEERQALNKQAHDDWEAFLLMRSRELKHGGILLTTCVGEYDTNTEMDLFRGGIFVSVLTDVWRSFRDSGKITSHEFVNTNFAICRYKLKQLKAPFEDPNSPVSQSRLRLLSAETIISNGFLYQSWKDKKEQEGIDDRQEFAKKYVASQRNWSHNVFLTGLSDSRTQKEKEEVVDELYGVVEKKIGAMNPEQFKNGNICQYVIVRKD